MSENPTRPRPPCRTGSRCSSRVSLRVSIQRGAARAGRLCGWTLARAHARTGDRVAIAAYLGSGNSFDRAILEFSEVYAEQNDRDYRALREAVDSGRIVAETGL